MNHKQIIYKTVKDTQNEIVNIYNKKYFLKIHLIYSFKSHVKRYLKNIFDMSFLYVFFICLFYMYLSLGVNLKEKI